MGSSNFFAKLASVDPLAQALHLPGSNKYAQQEAQDANSTGAVGPYAGVTPTLAGANSGYAPGGPGSNPNYVPFHAQAPGGLFGAAQRFSTAVGDTTPNPDTPTKPFGMPGQIVGSLQTGQPYGGASPYGAPAYVAASQQANMQPPNANRVMNTQPIRPQPGNIYGN